MHFYKNISALAILSLTLLSTPLWAASTKDEVLALKAEIQSMKESQQAIQSDLAEIKKLLQDGAQVAKAPPKPKAFEARDLSINSSPVLGNPDAPITLVEYSDYQCPYCRRHYSNSMPQLISNYVDTGKIKIVMKEFPLSSIHSKAVPASMAALCAGNQGKYWEMHNILFENQKALSNEDLLSYGQTLSLDEEQFSNCFTENTFAEQIQNDLAEGASMGIRGTPSFAMGYTSETDPNQVRVTKLVKGAASYDSFAKDIEALLSDESKGQPASP